MRRSFSGGTRRRNFAARVELVEAAAADVLAAPCGPGTGCRRPGCADSPLFDEAEAPPPSVLAAGLRAAAPGGANDILAASLESLLPSRRAPGRRATRAESTPRLPAPRPRLPPPPPPPPGRAAAAVSPTSSRIRSRHSSSPTTPRRSRAGFGGHRRVRVRVRVRVARRVRRRGGGRTRGGERRDGGGGVGGVDAIGDASGSRRRRRALLRAGGGGGRAVPSSRPLASLLEGAHSSAALELLQRVAGLRAEGAGEDEYDADEVDWGRVARLGSPRQMWDSVDANGGRAVDLMYGVMLSGGMDPERAALPACLVGDSVDQ